MPEVIQAEQQPSPEAFHEGPPQLDIGLNGEQLPAELQAALKSLVEKLSQQEQYSRISEIQTTKELRNLYQGRQHQAWNGDRGTWQVYGPTNSVAGLPGSQNSDSDMPTFMREYNLFLAFGKSAMAQFTQGSPNVRFEAEDPLDADDRRAAEEAQKMARIVEKFNPPDALQVEIARLMLTDQRVVAYTRYVSDGQRFGYEGEQYPVEQPEGLNEQQQAEQPERIAKGRETIDVFGVLETKLPATLRNRCDFTYVFIDTEFDINMLKAAFPKADIKASSANGQDEVARQARLSVNQNSKSGGSNDLNPEASNHLATYRRAWIRPSQYGAIDEKLAPQFRQLFPDGIRCGFVGPTYVESRNESMDDHIEVFYPLPGDGQSNPSLLAPLRDPQYAFNDGMNRTEESLAYGIPATWADDEAVDVDAVNEQKSQYGNHYSFTRRPGEPAADHFFTEPPVEVGEPMLKWLEMLPGSLGQFLTMQPPSVWGGDMKDQDTATAYQLSSNAAKGVNGLTWKPFCIFWANVMLQAVMCAANSRTHDVSAFVPSDSQQGVHETLTVKIEDLQGNILAYPETSENFPDSYSEKLQRWMQILEMSQANPVIAQLILSDPDNLLLMRDVLGLQDIKVAGADQVAKAREVIAELLKSTPDPPQPEDGTVQAIAQKHTAAQAMGVPLPPSNPIDLLVPSIKPDPEVDDPAVQVPACKAWLVSSDGRKAMRDNLQGYLNVRAYMLALKQMGGGAMPPLPPQQGGAQPPSPTGAIQ